MSKSSYAGQPRRSGAPLSAVAIGVLAFGVVGGALLLHAAGVVRLPFLTHEEPPKKVDHTGLVRVPVSARNIPSYTQVGREHVMDPKTGEITAVWMKPADVTDDLVTELKDLFGGVLRREKPAGFAFAKTDFYPKGTRPGPTAGIPEGKRALRLPVAQLPGLHGLKQGDHFDVVMAVQVEIKDPPPAGHEAKPVAVEGPYAGIAENQQRPPQEPPRIVRKRAEVRVVVKNGVIVLPVEQRLETEVHASLFKGSSLGVKPVEEILIAIDPAEVAALNQALAVGATLHVAMRSGQVASDGPAKPGEEIPDMPLVVDIVEPEGGAQNATGTPAHVKLVEVIQGGKKRLLAVPDAEAEAKPADAGAKDGAAGGSK